MYSIGEFSRITGLSIKALRLYHEKEILVPHEIDSSSGYRYYDHANVERARVIKYLRDMEFSLTDIGEILKDVTDESEAVDFLDRKRTEILSRIGRQKEIVHDLDSIIDKEKEAVMALKDPEFEVEERELDTLLIAGIRYKGKYSECGEMFGKLAKVMGRHVNGKAFCLYYDPEFKEEDADIEVCLPVRKGKDTDDIVVRELPGGRAVTLIHKGTYDSIGRSYEKITAYINEKGYEAKTPCREVYVKGPGMIFKGKPENYLTEIQMMI